MNVVVLTCDQPNQAALVHKLAAVANVRAVVLSKNIPRRRPKRSWRLLQNRLAVHLIGRPFFNAWVHLQSRYARQYPTFPDVETRRVDNVNDDATLDLLTRVAPDLVVVSGTNLVGRRIIEQANTRMGIVNLHTGISPYVKGGPNCTNWCLANRTFHLIGNTVMWLDPGIDTGAIITTEQTPLTGRERLDGLHEKVMDHAHRLYAAAVQSIAAGKKVPRVPQREIGEGATFYNADWSAPAMARAYVNFRRFYGPAVFTGDTFAEATARLRLVPLTGETETQRRPTTANGISNTTPRT